MPRLGLGLDLDLALSAGAWLSPASPYAAYDLALDFDDADYWASGTRYTDGPEIASNSSFDTDLTNWVAESGATTWVSGSARWNNPIANQHFYQAGGIQTTKTYILTVVISAIAGTVALRLNGGNVTGSNITTVGTHTAILRDGSANGNFSLVALSSGVDVTIDSFSIKEVSYSLLPGYAFTRTGEQGAVDSDGTVQWFAANTPAINSAGFHAYGAATNLLLRSQEFDNASWNKINTTVLANQMVAPDGTTSVDKATTTSGPTASIYQTISVGATTTRTASVFIPKSGNSLPYVYLDFSDGVANAAFVSLNLSTGAVSASQTRAGAGIAITAYVVDCDTFWRFVAVWVTTTNLSPIISYGPSSTADSTTILANGDYYGWQLQDILGNFPDGGPLIRTTTAAASIGEGSLSADDAPTDVEQLFMARAKVANTTNGRFARWDAAGADTNRIDLFQNGNTIEGYLSVGGVGTSLGTVASTANTDVVAVVRRDPVAGTWRLGVVSGGVVTWAAAATAGFPASLDKVQVGRYPSTTGYAPNGQVRFIGRKTGSFDTDAEVLAAVEPAL